MSKNAATSSDSEMSTVEKKAKESSDSADSQPPAGPSSSTSGSAASDNLSKVFADAIAGASGVLHVAKAPAKLKHINELLGFGAGKLITNWDPLGGREGEKTVLLPQTTLRIKKDLKEFFTDPLPEVFLVPDSEDMCNVHAIVIGPKDTPYEGGFFYFYVKYPGDYPIAPPRVKLMTTGRDSVRFNPNLYRNGKVCLSILGTWSGPGWSPANNLSSVLLSIQSLMNEKPYHNEPGFEEKGGHRHSLNRAKNQAKEDPVEQYNDIIRHETIRVAVLDMMDEDNLDTRAMPSALREKIIDAFRKKISHYEKVITDNMAHHGKPMKDPFGEPRGTFNYQVLKQRFDKLVEKHPPPDVDAALLGTTTKEYNHIAATHATMEELPSFPNANAKEVDAQAAIDDANYYLDAEGFSDDDELDVDDDEEEEAEDSDAVENM